MSTRTAEEAMALNTEGRSTQVDDPTCWVDRYGDSLLRFALRRVGRTEVAEDLVQDTLMAAWRARETFDKRASLGTWLCAILRRKIADHYRSAGRERAFDGAEASEDSAALFSKSGHWLESIPHWRQSPDELVENSEFWGIVAACMSTLPAHLSEAFQLREIGMASVDEICTTTAITPKNLSVRLHRARLLLRRCLDRKWFVATPQHQRGQRSNETT